MAAKLKLVQLHREQITQRASRCGESGPHAGVKGVPEKLDHYQVLVLCAAGKKYPEIAAELGISVARVTRILAKPLPKK